MTFLPVPRQQTVVLSQFPCWKHLTPEAYRDRGVELRRFGLAAELAIATEAKGARANPRSRYRRQVTNANGGFLVVVGA